MPVTSPVGGAYIAASKSDDKENNRDFDRDDRRVELRALLDADHENRRDDQGDDEGREVEADLESNWAIVAEAIQTILRREGYPNPYEALLNLTRLNKPVNKAIILEFIDNLEVSVQVKDELKKITPNNYTGI